MRIARKFCIRLLWCQAALALAACTTWQPLAHGLSQARDSRLPFALRITRSDGSRLALLAPFVRNDTLFGRVVQDTVAVPFQQIRHLEQERFSFGRTALLLAAIPATFLGVFLIYCGDSGCRPDTTH